MRTTHLRSVSDGASKLFCAFNSAMRSSFADNSFCVGRTVEIGGVTPHCRGAGAAITFVVRRGSRCWTADVLSYDEERDQIGAASLTRCDGGENGERGLIRRSTSETNETQMTRKREDRKGDEEGSRISLQMIYQGRSLSFPWILSAYSPSRDYSLTFLGEFLFWSNTTKSSKSKVS